MIYGTEFWALTLDLLGKLLILFMALLVHHRVEKEGKIDRHIIKKMKLEAIIGIMAGILFIASYVLLLNK